MLAAFFPANLDFSSQSGFSPFDLANPMLGRTQTDNPFCVKISYSYVSSTSMASPSSPPPDVTILPTAQVPFTA